MRTMWMGMPRARRRTLDFARAWNFARACAFARVLAMVLGCLGTCAFACPVDTDAPKSTRLSLRLPSHGETKRLIEPDLAAVTQVERVQRRTVAASDSVLPTEEQSIRYGGVLLRDLLQRVAPEVVDTRGARTLVVEAVATDGYKAVFAWGELFNSPAGEQVLLVLRQDGRALDAAQGPVALRALADFRPGPRHVRNLCALVLRS